MTEPILSSDARRLLITSRRATLATLDDEGRPRLVPICFVLSEDHASGSPVLHTALDEKPKRSEDPHLLARVRDITARPAVTLLADHWSEDWDELRWLRVRGDAVVLEPDDASAAEERAAAIVALRTKYRQYAGHDLEGRPLIRIAVGGVVSWAAREG
jgi:coenzyme F420-0:L-glutamate ligase/coenzyme F420-1:gamma-L-glutamate ligase